MRPRSTLAASALLATALTGAAVVPAHAQPHQQADPSLVVTVDTNKTETTLSASTITPGNTEFDLVGVGGVEIVSFKPGYTLQDFAKDAGNLFKGDVKTVRRVDKKVVFWGGAEAAASNSEIGINLPAGTYTVVNLDKDNAATLTVAGTPESRELPPADGKIKYVGDMDYRAPSTLPHQGWIEFDNKSTEPHFTDLQQVKKGTTKQQIGTFLMNGAQGHPSFAVNNHYEALIVSPGHTFTWYLDAKKGEYAELCFWPSKQTGEPHALMGMFDVSQLT